MHYFKPFLKILTREIGKNEHIDKKFEYYDKCNYTLVSTFAIGNG